MTINSLIDEIIRSLNEGEYHALSVIDYDNKKCISIGSIERSNPLDDKTVNLIKRLYAVDVIIGDPFSIGTEALYLINEKFVDQIISMELPVSDLISGDLAKTITMKYLISGKYSVEGLIYTESKKTFTVINTNMITSEDYIRMSGREESEFVILNSHELLDLEVIG